MAEFAVLYRANHQARCWSSAAQGNIPCKGVRRPELFDRAEIKDLCAWFRLWVNNDDDPGLSARHHHARRGIGHTTRCRTWAPSPASTR